jgi:hypothetical protein
VVSSSFARELWRSGAGKNHHGRIHCTLFGEGAFLASGFRAGPHLVAIDSLRLVRIDEEEQAELLANFMARHIRLTFDDVAVPQ